MYLFDGVDDSLSVDSAAVTGPPFSMACWFYPTALTADGFLIGVADKDFAARYHGLFCQGSVAGDPLRAHSAQGAGGGAVTSTSITQDVWQHACGVYASTTDRRVFLNGAGKGTDATSVTPTGIDRTCIGRKMGSSPDSPFTGRIAHAAIWSVALSDAEVAALAGGLNPRRIQSASLVGYWPMGDSAVDLNLAGTQRTFTVSGATSDTTPANNPSLQPWALGAMAGVG